jgi:hypothetical protein
MNPWGLLLILIGFILIVIGVKGTQSQVLAAFKGVKQGQSTTTLKTIGLS